MNEKTSQLLKDNESFLDNAALRVAAAMVQNQPPKNDEDATKIAKISYKQALGLLEVKLKIVELLERSTFLKEMRKTVVIDKTLNLHKKDE